MVSFPPTLYPKYGQYGIDPYFLRLRLRLGQQSLGQLRWGFLSEDIDQEGLWMQRDYAARPQVLRPEVAKIEGHNDRGRASFSWFVIRGIRSR